MASSIGQKFTPYTLLKFALPSMIMMVFMSCYTIIDGIFVSRFLGDHALSSVNIVYPIINILLAIGIMLATGGSAVVAKKLGENSKKEAREDFTFLVFMGTIFSIILLILTLAFLDDICRMLGASDILLENSKAYLGTLILFAPACMLQSLFQALFVTADKPHIGLLLTVLGGIANAIFDYVFLGVLGTGIEGAAIATGIGQLIPAVIGLIYFFVTRGTLYFVPFHFSGKTLVQASFNGSSEMVTNLSNAIITYLFNIILMKLAGESGVAAITIILYAQFLFNSMYFGFSMGVAPVFSFNYGAKNIPQLQHVYKICTRFVLVSSLVVTLFSIFSADIIVSIFVPRGTQTYELASNGFLLFSFTYLFSGFNVLASSMFTAFSDGKTSALLSFSRTFGFILLSLLILPALLDLNGVWLAIPMAEFLSVFLSVFYLVRKRGVYHYAPVPHKK